ncbi:MAG TPA: PEGA domain-containing protein [Bryobacteraceae bacterium]|nr:PEGA domain-containing protein [Bryobacteraceae bacterium]
MDQERAGTSPLDELKRLDEQVEQVSDLAGLKPVFYRLEEISKQFSGDFEVQLVVADVKQHLVSKGMRLKEALAGAPPRPPTTATIQTSSRSGFSAASPTPPAAGAFQGSGQYMASSPVQATPAAQSARPAQPARSPAPPALPPGPPNWKRAVGIGAVIGLVLFATFIVLVQMARHRNMPGTSAPAGTVPVDISTLPPGAAIRINDDVKCTSNCRLNLAPGNYTITALLDGFEPAASGVTITPGSSPVPVALTLQPQAQTVRLFADEPGQVVLDDQPAKDLQEGQLILDGVKNGKHAVRVTTKSGDSTFNFDVASGKPPVIDGPVTGRNLIVVLVSGSGGQAHISTSSPALKIALDGQPKGEAGTAGLDLSGVTPGDHELAIGEGKDEKKLVASFGPAPILTAFLKSDVNAGTLVVSTGENDVSVFLNNKEYRRKTQRGQIRIPWLGNVAVRVSKPGFQEVPEQQATVKKGEEARLEFTLKPLPRMAALEIRGGAPGLQVFLDQQSLGSVGPDGSLSRANVTPGDHAIELRRDHFTPKKLARSFKAGDTLVLSGPDLVLTATAGFVQIGVTPANATVSYHHADEPQTHEVKGNSIQLPTGVYTFTAKAPGFGEKSERVVVLAGESRNVELHLTPEKAAPAAVHAGTMADWLNPGSWEKNEDGVFVHKGGNFVQFRMTPTTGIFVFQVQLLKGGGVFHSGRIRWFLNFKDPRDYVLFELEKKALTSKNVVNGKSIDREKAQHEENKDNRYTIQLDVSPGRIVTKMQTGGQWEVLDDWKEPGRDFSSGTFGFYIPGNDEIGLTKFQFTPTK